MAATKTSLKVVLSRNFTIPLIRQKTCLSQEKPQTNGPFWFTIATLEYWNCLQESFTADGRDVNGSQLGKFRLHFSGFFPCVIENSISKWPSFVFFSRIEFIFT